MSEPESTESTSGGVVGKLAGKVKAAVGSITGNEALQREGNLHFAGEHTSQDYQGYIEGALRSGYRCAAEIGGR